MYLSMDKCSNSVFGKKIANDYCIEYYSLMQCQGSYSPISCHMNGCFSNCSSSKAQGSFENNAIYEPFPRKVHITLLAVLHMNLVGGVTELPKAYTGHQGFSKHPCK